MTTIVIADWAGYPLNRKKKIKKKQVICGIERMLDALSSYPTDLKFQCILVINTNQQNESQAKDSLLKRLFTSNKHNDKDIYYKLAAQYPFVTDLIFRNNDGMDIGAYDTGLKHLKKNGYEGDVILMNSSVSPPNHKNWLEKYNKLFHESPNTGACGITLNSHNTCLRPPVFMPHIQSFFIYSTMKILNQVFPEGIYFKEEDTSHIGGKDALVAQYEIGLSQSILDAGYGIKCLSFPDYLYFKGDKWSIPEGDIRFRKEFRHLVNQM